MIAATTPAVLCCVASPPSSAETKVIDIELGGPGNVGDKLADYTDEINRNTVYAVLGSGDLAEATLAELEERGLTHGRTLELIALHPARFWSQNR